MRSSPTSTLPDPELAPLRRRPNRRTSERPILVFFTSSTNGRCRRAESYLAQVIQRRHNHDTFALRFVDRASRQDLFDRFRIDKAPTLMVIEGNMIRGRLVEPHGCEEIQTFLAPWLR